MRRASFFLTVAAGLVASLALSASTQAGILYDVDSVLVVTVGTATSAEIEFTGPVTGPVTITSGTTLPTPVSATVSGDFVDVTFGSAGVGMYNFDFTVTGGAGLAGIGASLTSGGGVQGGGYVENVSAAVPEPTSMALLGIGMASFIAYRRLFGKRPVTA